MPDPQYVFPAVTNYLPSVGSSPSSIVFNGTLYTFFVGSDGQSLWCASYNTETLAFNPIATYLTQQYSSISVENNTNISPVVFENTIYIFFNSSTENIIYYTYSSDTINWSPPQALQSNGSAVSCLKDTSPSAAVFENTLYIFWIVDNNKINYLTYNGATWAISSASLPVTVNAASGTGPSALALDETLYVFYTGSGNNGTFYTTLQPGDNNWSNAISVGNTSNFSIAGSPSAVISNGSIQLFWNGSIADENMYQPGTIYATFTDNAWSTLTSIQESQQIYQNIAENTSASALSFNGQIYVFNTTTNQNIQYLTI